MPLIISSPYTKPPQHWKFVEERQPLERAEGRRIAGYMVADPKANPYQYRGIFVEMIGQMDCQLNAYCNPKGRVLALVRLVRRDSGFGMIVPADVAQQLLTRLKMFVLRAKVNIDLRPETACMSMNRRV